MEETTESRRKRPQKFDERQTKRQSKLQQVEMRKKKRELFKMHHLPSRAVSFISHPHGVFFFLQQNPIDFAPTVECLTRARFFLRPQNPLEIDETYRPWKFSSFKNLETAKLTISLRWHVDRSHIPRYLYSDDHFRIIRSSPRIFENVNTENLDTLHHSRASYCTLHSIRALIIHTERWKNKLVVRQSTTLNSFLFFFPVQRQSLQESVDQRQVGAVPHQPRFGHRQGHRLAASRRRHRRR